MSRSGTMEIITKVEKRIDAYRNKRQESQPDHNIFAERQEYDGLEVCAVIVQKP